MPDNVSGGLPNRGSTYFGPNKTLSTGQDTYGNSVGIEGAMKLFDDIDSSQTGSGAISKRSNRQQTCMLVRNTGPSLTMLPKRVVTWESGQVGKRVDGYVRTTAAQIAGVVDEHLPSGGVRQHDLFWIVVSGPTLVNSRLDTVAHDANDVMYALTAATSQATTAGRLQPMAATTGTTIGMSIVLNKIGRAISGLTSAQTATDFLVDVSIMKD